MHNKKAVLLIAFFCIAKFCLSQYFSTPDFSRNFKNGVSLFAENSFTSNSIPFSLTNTIFKGGFIDSELKSEIFQTLHQKNRFGSFLNLGFNYNFSKLRDKTQQKKTIFGFGYEYVNVIGIGFSKENFELFAYGNSAFIGKQTDLSSLGLAQFGFHKCLFSLSRKINSSGFIVQISPFVGFPVQGTKLSIDKGTLYTAADTSYITLSLTGSYTDIAADTKTFPIGFGTDIQIYKENVFKNYALSLSVKNFGFYNAEGKHFNRKNNEQIRYEGIVLNGTEYNDSIFKTFRDSLLLQTDFRDTNIQYISYLPVFCNLYFQNNPSVAFSLNGKLSYMNIPGYIPEIELLPTYKPIPELQLGLPVGYGGFADFHSGLLVRFKNEQVLSQLSAVLFSNPVSSTALTGFSLKFTFIYCL